MPGIPVLENLGNPIFISPRIPSCMDDHDSESADFKVLVFFSVLILALTTLAMVLEKVENRPQPSPNWYATESSSLMESGEQSQEGS